MVANGSIAAARHRNGNQATGSQCLQAMECPEAPALQCHLESYLTRSLGCFSITGPWFALVIEFPTRPQEAICYQVQVNLFLHGLIVMAQRGREDATFLVRVGPDTGLQRLGFLALAVPNAQLSAAG